MGCSGSCAVRPSSIHRRGAVRLNGAQEANCEGEVAHVIDSVGNSIGVQTEFEISKKEAQLSQELKDLGLEQKNLEESRPEACRAVKSSELTDSKDLSSICFRESQESELNCYYLESSFDFDYSDDDSLLSCSSENDSHNIAKQIFDEEAYNKFQREKSDFPKMSSSSRINRTERVYSYQSLQTRLKKLAQKINKTKNFSSKKTSKYANKKLHSKNHKNQVSSKITKESSLAMSSITGRTTVPRSERTQISRKRVLNVRQKNQLEVMKAFVKAKTINSDIVKCRKIRLKSVAPKKFVKGLEKAFI